MSCVRSCLALCLAALFSGCATEPICTLGIVNARIWTGDPHKPEATVLVVENGRFVYVGNDTRQATRCGQSPHLSDLYRESRVLDAQGARIFPGLIDSHLHLLSGGLQHARLNLRDVPDREAFAAAIAERVRQTLPDRWILGGRWSTESWPDPAQPRKDWIDEVTRDNPVLLSRMDGHGALANSVALKLAGIDAAGPPNPPGGQIERDPATGEPTGILKDTAIDLVEKLVPTPTAEELDAALTAAMREANQHGLTCVHTMSSWPSVNVFDRARREGRLTLRIRQYVEEADWQPFIDRAARHRGDEWFRIAGFKQYADGSMGSRTAYMAEPYSDNPPERRDHRGLLREIMLDVEPSTGPSMSDEDRRQDAGAPTTGLRRMCAAAVAAGFSPAIHAIGDQANHLVLDIYESLHENCPELRLQQSKMLPSCPMSPSHFVRQTPLRVEHAQHLLPADIDRFARLGVVASMQPLHKADDGRYVEKAIGPQRCQTSYAFRSLLDAGAPLAFGSDWPVVSLNPFLGIHAAVTGRTLDGRVLVPEQNISVAEALRAYTAVASWSAGDERDLGRIAVGYSADFVILEADPLTIEPDALKDIAVKATYVAGRQVWP